MKKRLLLIGLSLAAVSVSSYAQVINVTLNTNLGEIQFALDNDNAPKSVANFLKYCRSGFYDHTIFHRVIDGFMIQGGGMDADLQTKPTQAPIANEADNGLHNVRGTIAMARTSDPNSATSQFFINVADNAFLDHRAKTAQGWGYAVFGKVVAGMDVVDKIKSVQTSTQKRLRDVPKEKIEILSCQG